MSKRRTTDQRGGKHAAASPPIHPSAYGLIVVLYLVMAALYVARVPMWTQPDEGVHLGYVRYLVQHRKFPIFGGNKAGQLYEAHQPPLYYLLCTPAYLVTGAHRLKEREIIVAYLCRGVSALCGLGVVWLVGIVARSLFPSDKLLPLVAMGFAALLPMHLHVSASIGNDALAGLLCAATMAWMFSLRDAGSRFTVDRPLPEAAIAGALSGLALLSKSSCLFLLPLVAAFYFLRGRAMRDTRYAMRLSSVAVVVALLVVSPWWVRNQILYGDPLAARAFLKGFDNPGPDYFLVRRMNLPVFDYAVKLTLALTFMTFWGIFGEVNNAYKHYTQAVFGADPHGERGTFYGFLTLCFLFAAAALGGCLKECRAASSRSALLTGLAVAAAFAGWFAALHAIAAETTNPLTNVLFVLSALLAFAGWFALMHHASHITHHGLLSVGVILILLQFLQFNTRYFQAQARYLHPMLVGIAPLFVWGLDALLPRKMRPVWMSLLGGLLLALSAMNLTAWRTPAP
ncbi:MAG: hypothetical protein NZT92_06805 [Abditibacteriales bacterium]|nr:hypothetical protein [Abditibacteriales bacterium]MDW8365649.1 hypothetical protein [Abditibacteriales bacterium]